MDLHIAIGDHDAINEQFDQLAALGKGGLRQTVLHPLADPRNRHQDLGCCLLLIHLGLQVSALTVSDAAALLERLPTPLLLRERHHPGLLRIPSSFDLALQVLDALLQLCPTGLELLGPPRSGLCPLQGMSTAFWMRQHVTAILPDQLARAPEPG